MAGAARRRQSTTAEASWAISSAPSQAKSYSLPPFEKDTNVEIWTSVYKWRTTISITVKDGLLTQKDFSDDPDLCVIMNIRYIEVSDLIEEPFLLLMSRQF